MAIRGARQQEQIATSRYARAQLGLAKEVVLAVRGLLARLSPHTLIDSPDEVWRQFNAIVAPARRRSWRLGVAYYRLLRALGTGRTVNPPGETGGITSLSALWTEFDTAAGTPTAPHPDEVVSVQASPWSGYDTEHERRAIASSFFINGPARARRIAKQNRMRLDSPEFEGLLQAEYAKVRAGLAAQASRLTQNGGREAVHEAVAGDAAAVAYYRRINPGACYFCTALASRGAVYRTEQSAGVVVGRHGHAKGTRLLGEEYHPNCKCTPVPVFTRDAVLPQANRDAETWWKQAREDNGGHLTLNEFRQWLTQRKEHS